MTKITEAELTELREKAAKWDNFCADQKSRTSKLTPEQRQINARNAAKTRWEKYYADKRLETADATPSLVTKEEALEIQRKIDAESDLFIERYEAKHKKGKR